MALSQKTPSTMAEPNQETDHQIAPEDDGLKAVFVETSFGTRFAVAIPLSSTVNELQKQIGLEHFNLYPKFGRIMIHSVEVNVDEIYYHLPETMLLKAAFHGLKAWVVFAFVWTPTHPSKKLMFKETRTLPSPSTQNVNNHVTHVEPPSQLHKTPDTSGKKKNKSNNNNNTVDQEEKLIVKETRTLPSSSTQNVNNHVTHVEPPSQLHKTPNTSGKKKKKGKNNNNNNAVDQEEKLIVKETSTLPSPSTQNVNSHVTHVEPPSQLHKTPDTSGKKNNNNNNNAVDQGIQQKNNPTSSVVTRPCVVHQYANLQGKGDAPSVNGNTIQGCEQNISVIAAEVLSQNVSLMKPDNNSKKRTCDGEQESQEAVQTSHMSNVSELLTEAAPSKLENSAKKRKTNQILSSSTTQDLSSSRPNDNETIDGARHIYGELSQPDDGRPDESVGGLHSQNMKAVLGKDPLGSFEKQRLDEEIKEMASPINTIQSDKTKRTRKKKHGVTAANLSSELLNQQSNEVEMVTPKNVDDSPTIADANDALLKSDNTAAFLETNGNDQEFKITADVVSPSLLKDVSKVLLSQDEPLSLIEKEQEIKEDFATSKSEAKKRKTKKAKL